MTVAVAPPNLRRLPERWRRAPRRWGHPLHAVCSYFAMFPPQLAHVFVRWLTEPDEVIYDPFSGRGTVGLEATLTGRQAILSDANPLAVALSAAKVRIPSRTRALRRLRELRRVYIPGREDLDEAPPAIRMLYTDETLRQLIYLRRALGQGSADSLLRAMTLGMMHANHSQKGATRGFSVSMPNTFAMGPAYVEQYIAKHGLVAPECDVFAMLAARLDRMELPPSSRTAGRAWQQDATQRLGLGTSQPRLVLTSPPYLQVIKYGKYNWVRLWFLGEDPKDVDASLTTTSSPARYLRFMTDVLNQLRCVLAEDAFVALVIGDVRRGDEQLNLARSVADQVAIPGGWHCHGTVVDRLPTQHKVSRIWKTQPGRATKVDRVLLLSPQPRSLPPLSPIRWTRPSFAP
jgi:DNA methylase